jgi:hypothetical protein
MRPIATDKDQCGGIAGAGNKHKVIVAAASHRAKLQEVGRTPPVLLRRFVRKSKQANAIGQSVATASTNGYLWITICASTMWRSAVAELNKQRPRKEMWGALISGMATGYLTLMSLYVLFQ